MQRSGLSKADAQRVHALRRARLRVNVHVTRAEVEDIERGIKNGKWKKYAEEERRDQDGELRGKELYSVNMRGTQVIAAFDPETQAVCTFLVLKWAKQKRRQTWTRSHGWVWDDHPAAVAQRQRQQP